MRIYFDLTTSAQWGGHPVGIVRVERELARRALATQPDIRFCLHVRDENAFHEIDRDLVAEIVEGERQIGCRRLPPPAPESGYSLSQRVRRSLRGAMLACPAVYAAAARARGRTVSNHDIAELQRWHPKLPPHMRPNLPFAEDFTSVSKGEVELGADILLVSGGLDWEHKNIRALYALKQKYGFQYCAIGYDLIPILWPHYVVPAYVNILREYFGELMWLADYTLCISECTERDLLAFFDDNAVPRPKSAVFPLGCDIFQGDELPPLPAALHDKQYALFVSTIEPRKNHRTVYEAFDRAMRAGDLSPERDRLVFVGRKGWAVEEFMAEVRANPVTRDTIVTLENVTDALLARLYRDARFTLFPSHYEGYGLPVAEALAYGKICLMSAQGSLTEVDDGAGWRLDPKDVVAWSEAMTKLFNSPELVVTLEDKVRKQFRRTRWSEAADQFYSKLERLASA